MYFSYLIDTFMSSPVIATGKGWNGCSKAKTLWSLKPPLCIVVCCYFFYCYKSSLNILIVLYTRLTNRHKCVTIGDLISNCNSNEGLECKGCSEGYFLENGKCVNCNVNCNVSVFKRTLEDYDCFLKEDFRSYNWMFRVCLNQLFLFSNFIP